MLVIVNLATIFDTILKLIIVPKLFLGEHTVFYNSFTDLNCGVA